MEHRATHRPSANQIEPSASSSDAADPWITIGAAARYLAIPTRTLYRLAQQHRLPASKVGRTWRFKRSALDACLSDAGSDPTQERRPQPLPGIGAVAGTTPDRRDIEPATAALADLSLELTGLTDATEIARQLSVRLPGIFGMDYFGMLRLEGDELVALTISGGMDVPEGIRVHRDAEPLLVRALSAEDPVVVEDVSALSASSAGRVPEFGLRSMALVPVRYAGETWGLLALGARAPRPLQRLEVTRLRTIASQTGLALNNARLLGETRRWIEQLERIEALSRLLSGSRAVEAVAEAVTSQIDSVIDWHGLRFYLLAPDGVTLEPIKLASKVGHYAGQTPDLVRLQLGQGLGGHIALAGVAEVINDASHDPRTRQIPGTDAIDESMIVVPFRYEEMILGVMELFRLGRDAFDATDLRLAQIVGAQAAVALYNARQLEELQRNSAALERRLASQRQLLAITERLLVHRDRGAVLEAIADTLAEVVPHDTLTIYLVDREAGCLVPALARDEYAAQILATRPALDSGITGAVIARGEAEVINDASHDPRMAVVPGTPVEQREAMIVAPIRSPIGVIGALNLYRADREFSGDDLELVRLFTNHVAIALENASIHDQLTEAAVTDPLTSLPNRRLFGERVDHALERRRLAGTGVAVLFLDVDGFKLVNDSLGHAAGDGVLQAVAGRLRECTRATDTVARLGGDEFGILLEGLHSETDAIAAGERVVAALSESLTVDGREVSVRASMGIALDRGLPHITAVDLLRDADTAMYHAKANARGRFELFEVAMHARQLARLELEGELRQALARRQFALVYQPIVSIATGRVVGAEALLRWRHPTRSLGPQDFVALVEETGDIVPIGAWVLREACRQARSWELTRDDLLDFGISVNTSARELAEASYFDGVEDALRDAGLPADRLTLEITESVMLAEDTGAVDTLRRLRAAGVHVAVDDFGTGYSSLSYLQRLPVDGLKIDRSFINGLGREPERSAIVRATLSFARALGVPVTAEGVETEDQHRRLVALRCDQGQGYHFSAPLEPADMTELLSSGSAFAVPLRRSRARPRLAA